MNLAQLSDHELRRMIKKRLSYRSQCWALLAKSAIAQKRNYGTNTCQILTPIILVPASTLTCPLLICFCLFFILLFFPSRICFSVLVSFYLSLIWQNLNKMPEISALIIFYISYDNKLTLACALHTDADLVLAATMDFRTGGQRQRCLSEPPKPGAIPHVHCCSCHNCTQTRVRSDAHINDGMDVTCGAA